MFSEFNQNYYRNTLLFLTWDAYKKGIFVQEK